MSKSTTKVVGGRGVTPNGTAKPGRHNSYIVNLLFSYLHSPSVFLLRTPLKGYVLKAFPTLCVLLEKFSIVDIWRNLFWWDQNPFSAARMSWGCPHYITGAGKPIPLSKASVLIVVFIDPMLVSDEINFGSPKVVCILLQILRVILVHSACSLMGASKKASFVRALGISFSQYWVYVLFWIHTIKGFICAAQK